MLKLLHCTLHAIQLQILHFPQADVKLTDGLLFGIRYIQYQSAASSRFDMQMV